MKCLFVVSCVLAAVAATPLFGVEQCANGPRSWCENVRTASQCRAVKHCQQTVWNKPTVKSMPCDLCKEVVTVVGNFLKDNTTEGEIQAYLNKVCEFIPDPGMSSTCKQMLTEYFPLVFNILKEELSNPGVVCSALGVCTSLQRHLAMLKQKPVTNEIPDIDLSKLVSPFLTKVPRLLYPEDQNPQEPKNGDVCKDCVVLITDLQDSIRSNSSFSKKMVDQALKECDQLGGGLSDMCKTYVNEYADIVIQMLLQMKPDQLCTMAGLCEQTKSAPLVITPAKSLIPAVKLEPAIKMTEASSINANPLCEVCQLVIQEVETLLDNNRTRENILQALERVCDIVPKKYCQRCKDFIEDYGNSIIELLEQEASPRIICSALGLCSINQRQQIEKMNVEKVASGGCCKVCKMIMNYVDELLEKNATESQIQNFMKRVCNFLPEPMQDECQQIVDQYEPMIVQLLLQVLDPSFICMKLKLCVNGKHLLGSDECMWGPSYWCKDLETAARCNTVEHCKRHVWN
ncbi:prosaposin [Ascaphus truei]|uniref:prosaposin n=1 Tax=Ascaphus truei TaxID=8439 RepID=UPI003F591B4D